MRSVFDSVKHVKAIAPIAASAVQTSAAIDTKGFGSAMITVQNGAATGTPDSYTVNAKVQHCATSGGSYEDVSGASITQITADGKYAQIRLDGLGISVKRFIKVLVTPAMTGGTSPKALISADALLGRASYTPVSNSATAA